LRLVLAGSYARICWQNLANFGVLPLEYAGADCGPVAVGGRPCTTWRGPCALAPT
jgi:aconitase A